MIESSKITAFISQIQQADGATLNFKEKYRYYPGDAPTFPIVGTLSSASYAGDGLIRACGIGVANFQCEMGAFWSHLSITGFAGNYVAVNAFPDLGYSLPKSKLNEDTGIFGVTANIDAYDGLTGFAVGEPAYRTGGSSFLLSDGTKVSSALAVDKKMDDGIANTGKVVALWPDRGSIGYADPSSCVVSGDAGTYDIVNKADSETCTIFVKGADNE